MMAPQPSLPMIERAFSVSVIFANDKARVLSNERHLRRVQQATVLNVTSCPCSGASTVEFDAAP